MVKSLAATLAPPLAVAIMLAGPRAASAEPAFDFESGDLQGWTVVDGAFDMLLCDRAEHHHDQGPYSKQGLYFLSTLEQSDYTPSDRFMGEVESPEFTLESPHLALLVGGGKGPGVYVALCLADSGEEIRAARGDNAQVMRRHIWDVGEFVGETFYVKIVDRETGGWGHVTLDDVRLPTEEELATIEPDAARPPDSPYNQGQRKLCAQKLESLGKVLGDLADAEGLRDRIVALGARLEAAEGRRGSRELQALADDIGTIAREVMVANPLVGGSPIVFVVRAQYLPDHHNTATLFQTGEINTGSFRGGSALKTIDLRTGEASTLVDLPEGIARDPDVSFDGKRVLFAMRRNVEDDYHIYEVNADGSDLRQLTFGKGVSDVDPLYLPDGRIAFTSTREPKYCMCNRHIMGNLFRMDADGANVHQIGKSTLFEGHGNLMPDGRIMYDRWEYVDRNFGDAQGLWTCNPDGTEHAIYWGNNTPSPGGVLEARVIPGTQQILANLSSCHDRPWGALGIIDRQLGIDGKAPVVRTWPATAIDLVMKGGWDAFLPVNPKYEDPFPLDNKVFLCSRMTGEGERMGIYAADIFGNEALLHVEGAGCYDPMPAAPRERPPIIPDRAELAQERGYFYVHDVYQGTGMDAVERGTVKALRVVESPEKRFWTHTYWPGQGQEAPAMNWHDFNNKRIIGTVPVEPDGSAYFAVPPDRHVYFQLLDGEGMMVQSMRSGVIARPGETTGCVGCHEGRNTSVPGDGGRRAYARPPSEPAPWYGPERLFSYIDEVQPVFDRHCLTCHDYGKPGADKVILAGDRGLAFNASYNELWRRGYVHVVGAGPAEVQMPLSWGSHASTLVQHLRAGHKGVELDAESFDRLVTWIDLNAPYYPTYASAYPGNVFGRAPLNGEQLGRLGQLTGINFADVGQGHKQEWLVSFDRPELSPCLAGLRDKDETAYDEALAIIRTGTEALAKTPRGDMAGFAPAPPDAARDEKYEMLSRLAQETLETMLAGDRAYPLKPEETEVDQGHEGH